VVTLVVVVLQISQMTTSNLFVDECSGFFGFCFRNSLMVVY
jgi:hypothetical protein